MILVIEDDRSIREDLVDLLASEGYEVRTAENGRAALDLLASAPRMPALLLLDIMMPVMDGWQFRSAQVGDPRLASIPVIVMTADGHAPQKAAKMNAQGFARKPIDIDRLLEQIARHAA